MVTFATLRQACRGRQTDASNSMSVRSQHVANALRQCQAIDVCSSPWCACLTDQLRASRRHERDMSWRVLLRWRLAERKDQEIEPQQSHDWAAVVFWRVMAAERRLAEPGIIGHEPGLDHQRE